MEAQPAPAPRALEPRPGLDLGPLLGPRFAGMLVGWQHAPLAAAYFAAVRWCVLTSGAPREAAAAAAWAQLNSESVAAKAAAAAVEIGAEVGEELLGDALAGGGAIPGGAEELPEGTALPPHFLPGFWAVFCLVAVGLLHCLLVLVQHWSVKAKCWVRYRAASELRAGGFALVPPADTHRGRPEIVPVFAGRPSAGGAGRQALFFVSHKEKFEVLPGGATVRKVLPPMGGLLRDYVRSSGLVSSEAAAELRALYGPNKFDIPMPTFQELYKQQLLQPLSVFQIFCVALWLLDEAWKYALFGLVSVIGFEATSVTTRLKNIRMIRGMGNQSRLILVFRRGSWRTINTEEILPGDVISVRRMEGSGGDILPCDCLLLGGSAVVNEATLTGESVPQMKEAAGRDKASLAVNLDIEGVHKVNTLFGGTSIIQMSHSSPDQADRSSRAYPPDGGCPCYALRTGFSSSQGELVKMIELSSSTGSSQDPENMRDSVMMILLLMCFAIAASGYVLKQGMEQGDRTRYELLIHCILIITSVVPSDLPMQLALAVNASLMHLMKLQVFCTEPFRVPMSGRLDCCFFDKTGTITTDQLQAVGVVPSSSDTQEIVPTVDAPLKVAQVLAGCHTLLKVDGRMLGDPIETEAMTSIKWEYNHELRTAAPKEGRGSAPYELKQQVRIIHRYHFESKLQRMSTIAAVHSGEGGKPEIWLLTKGSPEKIAELLAPGEKPSWYEKTYRSMALEGMRVIALAWRPMAKLQDGSPASLADEETLGLQPRDWAERDLRFAGFISFKCLLRKDSPAVVRALQKSNHSVAMITGDNILTAIHVAGEVGIASTERSKVLTLALADDDDPMSSLSWVNADTGKLHSPLEPSACASLVQSGFALCSTGKTTQAAFEQCGPDVVEALRHVVVFARMTPDGKERVLARLKAAGHRTLMCGDGANDVGALKQADVGVALLGGFGSLNAAKGGEKDTKDITFGEEETERKDLEGLTFMERLKKNMAEAHEQQQKLQREKQKRQLEFRQKRAKAVEEQKKQKEKLLKEVEEETRRLQEQGAGAMAAFQAMKTVYGKQREEQRAKVRNQGGFFAMSAAAMAAAQEGNEEMDGGELPVLKLGDASIAAPFTSKWPSIKSVYDIIRQGRCTLVTSIQNNQILCLTSLISSYSLSVMYNDGIKFSDYQLTLTGICLTASHLSVSYAQPLKQISAARPLTSMFSPALFTSTMGQFAIHLGTMIYAVHCAKTRLPRDWKAPGMDKEFQPNLINTVVFLIETVQQVSVLMVNYKGRPFQPSFTENKALLHSLGICGIGTLVCAYELIPKLNEWLGMVTLPDDQLRSTILVMLLIDIFGCLLWDRAMIALFAPKIFRASMEATSVQEMIRGAGKLVVSGGAIWLLVNDGGIVSILIIFWLYRSGFF